MFGKRLRHGVGFLKKGKSVLRFGENKLSLRYYEFIHYKFISTSCREQPATSDSVNKIERDIHKDYLFKKRPKSQLLRWKIKRNWVWPCCCSNVSAPYFLFLFFNLHVFREAPIIPLPNWPFLFWENIRLFILYIYIYIYISYLAMQRITTWLIPDISFIKRVILGVIYHF